MSPVNAVCPTCHDIKSRGGFPRAVPENLSDRNHVKRRDKSRLNGDLLLPLVRLKDQGQLIVVPLHSGVTRFAGRAGW